MLKNNVTPKPPNIFEVWIFLAIFLFTLYIFIFSLQLPIQIALFIIVFYTMLFGKYLGNNYAHLQQSMANGIKNGLEAIFILICVGALIGTWIAGGIVPGLIYYGLQMIDPKFFLVTSMFICSLTSMVTGTSWGTVGTTGLALMGIGHGLGIPLPLIAGSILSGAYFGDKLSPLSDSTLLASSMSKVKLIDHIKSMLYVSVPAFIITAILYLFVGLFIINKNQIDLELISTLQNSLVSLFEIGPHLFIPIITIFVMLFYRFPAFPTIAIGALLGVIWAVVFQKMSITNALSTAYFGHKSMTGIEFTDKLLTTGGIENILSSILVIFLGLGLGGMLESIGILDVIVNSFAKKIKSRGLLTVATIIVAILGNALGCAMYVSLILTPKIMEKLYDYSKTPRNVLSRNAEVGGTLTSGLIPWSDNGIYMSLILGVSTLDYLPYVWLSYVSIFLTIFYGYKNYFQFSKEFIKVDYKK